MCDPCADLFFVLVGSVVLSLVLSSSVVVDDDELELLSVLRMARQTVSVCACTPATASTTSTAPSNTATDRCTSTEKSTCPGVSIRFIDTCCGSFLLVLVEEEGDDVDEGGTIQSKQTAALCIVIPRSLSAGR